MDAVFGERWGRLNDQLAMLYGGIDSKEVTERATDPSGAMGAIQRILANDVACKHIAARLRPQAAPSAGCSPASSRTCARRLARGRRADPQGDRPPARARPRPRRRRRLRGGRAHVRAVRRHRRRREGAEGHREASRATPAGPTCPTPRPTRTTPSAPGAAWSRTCCAGPNSFTSNRHATRPTRLPQALRPGRPRPRRPAPLPAARPRRTAKDEPYDGPYYVVFNASGGWDTTYLMDPKGVNGINRLYKEGDILTQGRAQVRPDREAHQGRDEQRGLLRRVRRRAARRSTGSTTRSTTTRPAPATWRPASSTAWPTRRSPPSSPPARGRPARSRS